MSKNLAKWPRKRQISIGASIVLHGLLIAGVSTLLAKRHFPKAQERPTWIDVKILSEIPGYSLVQRAASSAPIDKTDLSENPPIVNSPPSEIQNDHEASSTTREKPIDIRQSSDLNGATPPSSNSIKFSPSDAISADADTSLKEHDTSQDEMKATAFALQRLQCEASSNHRPDYCDQGLTWTSSDTPQQAIPSDWRDYSHNKSFLDTEAARLRARGCLSNGAGFDEGPVVLPTESYIQGPARSVGRPAPKKKNRYFCD